MSKKVTELGNLLLIAPFAYALLYPQQNIDFIYDTGVVLFLAEFLTIHANGMLSDPHKQSDRKRIPIFLFYIIFVVVLLATTKSPQILYFLIVSFITKFFIFKNASPEETFAKPALVLLCTLFFVILTSGLLKLLVPLPDQVLLQKPAGAKGLFVEVPQTILVWGLIYPIGLYLVNFVNLPIKIRKTRRL